MSDEARAPYVPSEHTLKGLGGRPSLWLERFTHLFPKGAKVLDLACGCARNTNLLVQGGFDVTGCDIDERCAPFVEKAGANFIRADLEGDPWPFKPAAFDVIVVEFYLWRKLFPDIEATLKDGGFLVYETFMMPYAGFVGNRAKNPDFVLKPLELPLAFRNSLETVAYEESLSEKGDCFQKYLGRKFVGGVNCPVLVAPLN